MNINRNDEFDKNPLQSNWSHFAKFISGSETKKLKDGTIRDGKRPIGAQEVLKKYEKRKENIQYKEIKSPNYPFMFVEKQKMDKLKELTTAYRKKLR